MKGRSACGKLDKLLNGTLATRNRWDLQSRELYILKRTRRVHSTVFNDYGMLGASLMRG